MLSSLPHSPFPVSLSAESLKGSNSGDQRRTALREIPNADGNQTLASQPSRLRVPEYGHGDGELNRGMLVGSRSCSVVEPAERCFMWIPGCSSRGEHGCCNREAWVIGSCRAHGFISMGTGVALGSWSRARGMLSVCLACTSFTWELEMELHMRRMVSV
ncbi:uncharacterized protein LOC120121653 [Hibiscus syriacus]|uniref:uncharacterized protein LOC120121653 n=1 Tax=Hibiscus syriacus TaxID=106335 RepID=UPI00192405C9|nr:uncharacterized protein LOC120121653 [Hibiscus syriacus]